MTGEFESNGNTWNGHIYYYPMRFLERSSYSGITPITLVSERSWAPTFAVERERGEGGLLEKIHVNYNHHIKIVQNQIKLAVSSNDQKQAHLALPPPFLLSRKGWALYTLITPPPTTTQHKQIDKHCA